MFDSEHHRCQFLRSQLELAGEMEGYISKGGDSTYTSFADPTPVTSPWQPSSSNVFSNDRRALKTSGLITAVHTVPTCDRDSIDSGDGMDYRAQMGVPPQKLPPLSDMDNSSGYGTRGWGQTSPDLNGSETGGSYLPADRLRPIEPKSDMYMSYARQRIAREEETRDHRTLNTPVQSETELVPNEDVKKFRKKKKIKKKFKDNKVGAIDDGDTSRDKAPLLGTPRSTGLRLALDGVDSGSSRRSDDHKRPHTPRHRTTHAEDLMSPSEEHATSSWIVALRQDNERLQRELKETQESVQKVCLKLEAERTRLVEMTARKDAVEARLSVLAVKDRSEGGPGSGDLSDDIRPAKLAERFAEMHEAEWANAFEYLTEMQKREDTEAVYMLLSFLLGVYDICQLEAKDQLERLHRQLDLFSGVSSGTVMKETIQMLIRSRKMNYKSHLPDIMQRANSVFVNVFSRMKNKPDPLGAYFRLCVELCWLMSVQDPVVILHVPERGELFDTTVSKPYTNSGKYVDFCVWPSVFLHKDGPLLAKGVAQGTHETYGSSFQVNRRGKVYKNDGSTLQARLNHWPEAQKSKEKSCLPSRFLCISV